MNREFLQSQGLVVEGRFDDVRQVQMHNMQTGFLETIEVNPRVDTQFTNGELAVFTVFEPVRRTFREDVYATAMTGS